MKKHMGYFFLTLSIALPAAERAAALSAVYGGGPIYLQRDYSLEELRNSGFTTLIVWTIHIEANGDLGLNGEFPLVLDGVYIGDQTHPEFPGDIASLKSPPSSINRIEFGLSAWGSGTYDAVKALIEAEGTGPGTTLYENFKALKEAIPEIDALNNDDESTYDVPSSVAFSIMLYDLGFKTTLVPYTRAASYWRPLTEQVNAARPGAIDALYLQAYAGGSGNSPCSSSWNFGLPVYPGLWSRDYSPAGIESRMQSWKDECGIEGGFMWLYDDFDNSSLVGEYATAINHAVDGGNGDIP